jgi:UDP-glucose 4-epimerase
MITGGAGYVGSYLIYKLLQEKHEVFSIDDMSNGDYSYLEGLIEPEHIVVGDIRDAELLDNLFEDVDAVVHLAAIPGLVRCNENPEEAVSVNVYGTYQVLEAARKQGVKKVIFSSSAASYGIPRSLPVKEDHPLNPMNLYGVTKLAGEKLMRVYYDNYNIETITLRFGNIYGVGLFSKDNTVIPKFVRMGLEGNTLTIYGDGSSTREYVHVDDVVQSIMRVTSSTTKGGEVYNVGGHSIKIRDIADKVTKAILETQDKKIESSNLPERSGETKYLEYNIDKVTSELGYKPTWNVDMGIRQLIEYFTRVPSL